MFWLQELLLLRLSIWNCWAHWGLNRVLSRAFSVLLLCEDLFPFLCFTWLAPGLIFAAPISNPSWSNLHNVSVCFVCHVVRTLWQPGWVVQPLLFSQGRVKLTYKVLGNPRVHWPCGTYENLLSKQGAHSIPFWSFLHKISITLALLRSAGCSVLSCSKQQILHPCDWGSTKGRWACWVYYKTTEGSILV